MIIGEGFYFLFSFGFTFLLIWIFSVEEFSYYNRIIIIPSILIYLFDFGISYGCQYYIARLEKLNKKKEKVSVIKITLVSKFLIGIGLSLSVWIFSEEISVFLGIYSSNLVFLLKITSILIITKNLLEGIWSILIGSTKIKVYIIIKLIQNIMQFSITFFFLFFGWKYFAPISGFILSTSIASLLGFLYILRKFLKFGEKNEINWNWEKKLVKKGFFFSLNSIINNTKHDFFILILALFCFYPEISYLKIAVSINSIFYLFLRPVKIIILPIFSKYTWNSLKERKILIKLFHYAIKFCLLFVTPIIIFSIIFTSKYIPLIFGMKYKNSWQFISIFLISFLPLTFGMIALPSFFFSQENSLFPFLLDFIPLILSIFLSILFSFILEGIGFALGISFGSFLGFLFAIIITNKKFNKDLFSKINQSIQITLINFFLSIGFFIMFNFFKSLIGISLPFIDLLGIGVIFVCYYLFFLFIIIQINFLTYDEISYFINEFKKIPLINRFLPILEKLINKD